MIKIKIKEELFNGKTAVHCKTQEQWDSILDYCKGDTSIRKREYASYKDIVLILQETASRRLSYGSLSYAKSTLQYELIPFEDIIDPESKLKESKHIKSSLSAHSLRHQHGKYVTFRHPHTQERMYKGRLSIDTEKNTWGICHDSLDGGTLTNMLGYSGSWAQGYSGITVPDPIKGVYLEEKDEVRVYQEDDRPLGKMKKCLRGASGKKEDSYEKAVPVVPIEGSMRFEDLPFRGPQIWEDTTKDTTTSDTYAGIKVKKTIQWK